MINKQYTLTESEVVLIEFIRTLTVNEINGVSDQLIMQIDNQLYNSGDIIDRARILEGSSASIHLMKILKDISKER